MIKGPFVEILYSFSGSISYLITMGSFKDLPGKEVLEAISGADTIIAELRKDPCYSTVSDQIDNFQYEVQEVRKTVQSGLSADQYYVVRGAIKTYMISKITSWNELVHNMVSSYLFSTLSDDSLSKFFPPDLVKKCGVNDFKDILDGGWCIIYGYPTPGAMILFRSAERESRKYYKKLTGYDAPLKWYDLINDLRKKQLAKDSILNYMDFIRDKRNSVGHPDKRYTAEEAEAVLQHLSSLLKEIYS